MPPHLTSFHSGILHDEYLPPYQPPNYYELQETPKVIDANSFYYPTPPPQTVVIHKTPTRSKDSCCWGW
ncbi:hypothetical protein G6F56_005161 [Rhizopus delemar]|nr:hypothetical protein G6F56_005161 [Rhizopus delemar]